MIRRVFMATINYDHPQRGMIHAFVGLFGADNVLHYDYLTRLRETNWGVEYVNGEMLDSAVAFRPDWAWLQLQNTSVIAASTLRKMRDAIPGCVLTHWTGDVRDEVGDYLASICGATHLTFAANVGHLGLYERAGAPEARYVAHGLDWEEDVAGLPEWEPPFRVPDVVFVGNHYGAKFPGTAEREAAVRAVHEAGFDCGVVGSGWESTRLPVAGRCGVKQQTHVYRRAKVALAVNHFPDLPGYHGDRQIVAMASGTPVVCRRFPLLEREFSEGVHVLAYRTEPELVGHVRTLLGDAAMRRRLGSAGRAEAIAKHTWFSRIFGVMPMVEEAAGRLREVRCGGDVDKEGSKCGSADRSATRP